MPKLRPIMFVGTGSDVGKSVINAGFCRIFLQDGYSPAPFKAQNMSLNSFVTPDGLEIGRAQAAQAEACGIECSVEMNPVLLKPNTDKNAQVVLNGKPAGNQSAQEYFNGTDRNVLFHEAMKSFHKLEERYNPIVIEGAGSISEINLWDKDIVNMRVAEEVQAATYLIADIDRGGVFASVYGTLELLPETQRKLIKGVIINKFRGDIALFENGRAMLEKLTGVPVIGVVPYFQGIDIEQEDSVVLDNRTSSLQEGKINIAVVLLRHMSNFTDFNALERVPEVHLFYSDNPHHIKEADIAILPGSKNTISDLIDLKNKGIDDVILSMHKQGKQVYGICGGFQMMGEEIADPFHVESTAERIKGLGIFPMKTVLEKDKRTIQQKFTFLQGNEICEGYEIHMGRTYYHSPSPLCTFGSETDGYYLNDKTWGTYMHGIFDNSLVINHILSQVDKEFSHTFNHKEYKNKQYDLLAEHIRKCIDMEYVYSSMKY